MHATLLQAVLLLLVLVLVLVLLHRLAPSHVTG